MHTGRTENELDEALLTTILQQYTDQQQQQQQHQQQQHQQQQQQQIEQNDPLFNFNWLKNLFKSKKKKECPIPSKI